MSSPVDTRDWVTQDPGDPAVPWVSTPPSNPTDGLDLSEGKFQSGGKRPVALLVQFYRIADDATITDVRVHVFARGVWSVVTPAGTSGVSHTTITLTAALPGAQFRLPYPVDDRVAISGTPSQDVGIAIAPEWG